MNNIETIDALYNGDIKRIQYHIDLLQHEIYVYGYCVVEAFASVYFCELSKMSATH